jgi:hypothetical protein
MRPSVGNLIPGVASLLQVSNSSRWNDDVSAFLCAGPASHGRRCVCFGPSDARIRDLGKVAHSPSATLTFRVQISTPCGRGRVASWQVYTLQVVEPFEPSTEYIHPQMHDDYN